jgi:transmembrane sensor
MTSAPPPLNTQIYDEAAEWFVEFRAGEVGETQRRRFCKWLRASPEHQRAYLELAAIWTEGPRLDAGRRFDEQSAGLAAEPNVIALDRPQELPSPQTSHAPAPRASTAGRWTRVVAIAVPLAAAFGLVIIGGILHAQRGLYGTDVGEQRSITLTDGTRIELNARSKLRVSYSKEAREVDLIHGQALFSVARDAGRPFVVSSDRARIRAIGTRFDVYRKPDETTVTVVEGKVGVHRSDGAAVTRPAPQRAPDAAETRDGGATHRDEESAIVLAAGEQVIITARATVRPDKPDIAAATAWTQRRLVFQATPLAEVAAEFNRYNPRRLVIRSPELTTFRISGMFSSTDPAALLQFLQARPGITVTEHGEEIIVSQDR